MQHKPMQWPGTNLPSQILCPSMPFLTQLAECISVCWFTVLNTSLHESPLQLWRDGRHLSLIKNICFIICPLTIKKGHSVCLLIFILRETKQIELFHIGLAQGISKMTALRAICIAPCQNSAWLKVSHFRLYCPQGWRGGEAGASSSSCTTA